MYVDRCKTPIVLEQVRKKNVFIFIQLYQINYDAVQNFLKITKIAGVKILISGKKLILNCLLLSKTSTKTFFTNSETV